jgi:hypothetical protein
LRHLDPKSLVVPETVWRFSSIRVEAWHARAAGKGEPNLLNSSDVIPSIRDLIVHLHRGNGQQAELIVTDVAGYLKETIGSRADPGSLAMQRAQQTMFAIDEVGTLLSQRDFEGAAIAARDAAKEWRSQTGPTPD